MIHEGAQMKLKVKRNAAMLAAGMLLASTAWSAATLPSIEITGITGGSSTCAGSGGLGADADIIDNLPTGNVHSDNYEVYNGATLLYRWIGESYDNVGPTTYGLGTTPGITVPANTVLTAVIYTFPTATNPAIPYTSDKFSYRSEVQWDCTTGTVVSITNTIGTAGGGTPAATAIPALQPAALAALVLLLGAGTWYVRRRS